MSFREQWEKKPECLITGNFKTKPSHKERAAQWWIPETSWTLNLDYAAWLSLSWTQSHWVKLILASQDGEWLCSFLLFLLSSVSCICVEQKFIVVGTTPKLNRSAVVFCFLQSSFCIHLVVLPRIWQQAFCFTTVYSRKTGNVFLVSDVEVIESTQGEVGIQWYITLHICWVHLSQKHVRSCSFKK